MLVGRGIGLGGADPFFGNVIFLASFDGGSGETFTPEVGPSFEWYKNGSGTQPTQYDGEITSLQDAFGSGRSCYFKEVTGAPSAGWQTQSATSTGQFHLPGDFTVEAHVRPAVYGTGDIQMFSIWDFGTYMFRFYIDTAGKVNFVFSEDGTTNANVFTQETINDPVPQSTLQTDTWYHIAVCRDGNDWHMFVDGQYTDGPNNGFRSSLSITPNNATTPYACIGQNGFNDGNGSVEAYVDNIRITRGVARYTSTFTPPTAPYPGSTS